MNVSILIPCYNAERWIAHAIRSALEQTWRDAEVLVVDDGSSDGSLSVIRSFGDAIRWETGPNRGGNAARNRLLELARGEWLQYLDADDYLLPEKLERQLAAAGDADVVWSPIINEWWDEGRMVRRDVEASPEETDDWVLLVRWLLPQTTSALWRKDALVSVGGWDESQTCCQEDQLHLRLLKAGKTYCHYAEPQSVYRLWNTGTVSRRNPLAAFEKRLAVMDEAERRLEAIGALTDERRDAIAHGRLECARAIYQHDRAAAERTAAAVRKAHPEFRPPQAACFPRSYRMTYGLFGFGLSERLAGLTRSVRRIARPAPAGQELSDELARRLGTRGQEQLV